MSNCTEFKRFVNGNTIKWGFARAICHYFKPYDKFCACPYYLEGDQDLGLECYPELEEFDIYTEPIAQNFKTPSFHIQMSGGNETKEVGNNYIFYRIVQIRYYPRLPNTHVSSHIDLVNDRIYEATKLIRLQFCDMTEPYLIHTQNHTWFKDGNALVRTCDLNLPVQQVLPSSPKMKHLDLTIYKK